MIKNMGIADRVVRVIIALVVTVLYFTNVISGTVGIILVAVGGILLLTSFVSFCPIYFPFGVRTCKIKEAKRS